MGGKPGEGGKNWLLKKLEDDEARSSDDYDILTKMTTRASSPAVPWTRLPPTSRLAKPRRRPRREAAAPKRRPATSKKMNPIAGFVRPAKTFRCDVSALEGAKRADMPATVAPRASPAGRAGATRRGMAPRAQARRLPDDQLFARWQGVARHPPAGMTGRIVFRMIAGSVEEFAHRRCDPRRRGRRARRRRVRRLPGTTEPDAAWRRQAGSSTIVFDLLYHYGHDFRQVALFDRKQLLSQLLNKARGGE